MFGLVVMAMEMVEGGSMCAMKDISIALVDRTVKLLLLFYLVLGHSKILCQMLIFQISFSSVQVLSGYYSSAA